MTLTPTSTPAALIEAAYAAARWLANAHVDLAEARAERGPLDAKDEEECAAAVAAAERAGLLAVGAVRAGRWPDAFLHANEAWSCEACFSAWCDAPTWGPLLQAIKEGERWAKLQLEYAPDLFDH